MLQKNLETNTCKHEHKFGLFLTHSISCTAHGQCIKSEDTVDWENKKVPWPFKGETKHELVQREKSFFYLFFLFLEQRKQRRGERRYT